MIRATVEDLVTGETRVKEIDDDLWPRPSDPSAAFFTHRPGEKFDLFYDDCWGWG